VLVMGVLNITPDSFYTGERYTRPEDAIERGLRMAQEGADIIDIGGESSRPGSRSISSTEELERVLPVIEGVHRTSDVLLSVDTTKSCGRRRGNRMWSVHRERHQRASFRPQDGRGHRRKRMFRDPDAHAGHSRDNAGQPNLHRSSQRDKRPSLPNGLRSQ